jgi:uncharacterized protein YndB with AHSA1/START domain
MKTIHHVVDMDVEAATVWSAITEQRGLAGWWSTKVRAEGASVGDRVAFTFAPGFNPVMEVTAGESGVALAWRCVDGHEPWSDNTFRFEIAPLDDGRVRLRFWQDYAVELTDDAFGTYNFNWGYYLESLRLLCTTGAGKPYQPASPEE